VTNVELFHYLFLRKKHFRKEPTPRTLIRTVEQSVSYRDLRKVKSEDLHKDLIQMNDLTENQIKGIKNFKFGVLYYKKGQTEDEMFSNAKGSEAYNEFLKFLGDTVHLKDWRRYTGGLDSSNLENGETSIFTEWKGCEVMFHVATLMPLNVTDPQQVLRKAHIGNDIVVIIFMDDDIPFTNEIIHSQMNHIFAVVSVAKHKSKNSSTHINFRVDTRSNMPPFAPIIPNEKFKYNSKFRDLFFTKLTNGVRESIHAPFFYCKID